VCAQLTTRTGSSSSRFVIRELFYITHVNNIKSILEKGILCHKRIEDSGITYERIYNKDVVSRREAITVPDGRSLWSFANLYFQARNPMLYTVVRNNPLDQIAVVGVDKGILDRPDIFLATGNAAHSQTEIVPASQKKSALPTIIRNVNRIYWNEVDGSKRTIMAECLVPDFVPPHFIRSIYFGDYKAKYATKTSVGHLGADIPFMLVPGMFFQPIRSRQITSSFSVVDGDMFFSQAQTLTVSVNTVGVMGKGVASRAKYQFPDVYVFYQDVCRNRRLKIGKPIIYKRESSFDFELADEPSTLTNANAETWFLLFPTKKHWRDDSNINDIEAGLQWIAQNYKKEGIKSLALPALGCGLGRLDWAEVGPLICQYLSALDIPVYVYLPAEHEIPDKLITPEFLLSRKSHL
jgi:O-acetyl-ADP-ribose deacetylase (regulator of RNase III)